MPALEMAQETGKLIAWRKKEGARVSKGEPLLDIETDKAVVEVEAPADGILTGIKAAEGAEIPVGQTIAWIVAPGEVPPADAESRTPAARVGAHAKADVVASVAPPDPLSSSLVTPSARISPKARRLAKELGLDITTVRGTGPAGEILASDIQSAGKPHASPGPEQATNIEPLTSIGRIMAERTTHSWTAVPHFFVTRDVDATALNAYRDAILAEPETKNIRVTHTDLLIGLVSRVLLKHPRLNASWSAEGIHLHPHVHMGVAIAVNAGVVAAVIPHAHAATLHEIAAKRKEISERAHAGKLRPADIADATFTISNLGMYQVDRFCAIITPPQAAILAVGAIADRVVAMAGKAVVCPMMSLTISCDHRIVDGAKAATFLSDLAHAIQNPKDAIRINTIPEESGGDSDGPARF